MITYERPHVDQFVRLVTDDSVPARIVAITGPRQSGKTTIVWQALRHLHEAGVPGRLIAVDDPQAASDLGFEPSLFGSETAGPRPPTPTPTSTVAPDPQLRNVTWLTRVWQWARDRAWQHDRGFVLALDEIQDIPGWSGAVKGLWDRDRQSGCPLKVVILGSAPWALLTGRGESLAGRFMPLDVRHWSLREMVQAFEFSLDEYLFFGGYPGAAPLRGDIGAWRRYVAYAIIAPVFGRDIVALSRVDKPALMRQLVDLVPAYSGQIVTYNHLVGRLRDAGNATTIGHYLDLLSDAGIVTQLPNHSGSAVRRSGSSPKLNVLNTGLMTALSGYSFEGARADRTFWGRIVESAVGAHLHSTLEPGMHLSYWRDHPNEVDFVLSQGPNVLGIEVKSGRRAGPTRGMTEFERRFPRARTLLVGGRRGVPVAEFLGQPAADWLEERS